jgi:hypothetical protein
MFPQLIKLGLYVTLETLRTHAMRKGGVRLFRNVYFNSLPGIVIRPDSFAVRADRKESFELFHFILQAQYAFRNTQPGIQFVDIKWLGDEIIGTRVHPFKIALLAAERRQENDIRVFAVLNAAD